MKGYTVIENALIAKLLVDFSTELSAERCRSGDPDGVLNSMFDAGAEYGCFIEYNGGRPDDLSPFKTVTWIWSFLGFFLIQRVDDIEIKLRAIVDKLCVLFDDDHTLGGCTPAARFANIGVADVVKINDTPFYWLPFEVEALDR